MNAIELQTTAGVDEMATSSDSETVSHLLRDAGLPAEMLNQAGDVSVEEALLTELEAVSKEMPQGDTGGTRIIVAGRHFSLGEAGWKLTTSLVALAISSLDPSGLTKVIALKEALDLLKELRPLLKKLDQGKLLICSAISSISADKKRKSIDEPGASEREIVDYFKRKEEDPPIKLGDILKSLEADEVLQATYMQQSGPFYKIVF
jgi:hypothetical protein